MDGYWFWFGESLIKKQAVKSAKLNGQSEPSSHIAKQSVQITQFLFGYQNSY